MSCVYFWFEMCMTVKKQMALLILIMACGFSDYESIIPVQIF